MCFIRKSTQTVNTYKKNIAYYHAAIFCYVVFYFTIFILLNIFAEHAWELAFR